MKSIALAWIFSEKNTQIKRMIPGFSRSEFLRLRTEVNWLIRKYKPHLEMRQSKKKTTAFIA
jgi:hypothetical protein